MAVYAVITSNGTALPITLAPASVEIVREANRIPYARFVLDGGHVPSASFPGLEGDMLAPGAAIAIEVRDGDAVTPLFAGLLLRLAFEVSGGGPRLTIECHDAALRLTGPRRTAIYTEMSDSDAIGAVLRRAGGVTAGDLGPGGAAQPMLVQYGASDWDFILARAAANGLAVVATDGTIDLKPLKVDGAPVLSVTLGMDIDEIELELDAGGQFPDFAATGWDLPQGAGTTAATADPLVLAQGDLDPAETGTAIGLTAEALVHLVPLSAAELKAWASTRLAQRRLGMIRGRLAVAGTAAVAPMDVIELAGVGARFAGKALVTAVRHSIEAGGWRTDLRLGLPREGLFQPEVAAAPAAGGLLPPAAGLHIGIVADYEDDPAGEFRVRVLLPELAGAGEPLWARLVTPEAGNARGQVFRPDAGDEVIIGFLGDDPRQPVVLGALHGSKNALPPDFAPSADNTGKGWVTKNGIAIAFKDQDKPVVTIKTKAGTLTIDDDKEAISIIDGHDNVLTMDKDGVTITAGKDFTVEAAGKVVIKGASIDLN